MTAAMIRGRLAIMRGRHLLGLSIANRRAAGVQTGEEVEVDVELDAEPHVLVEPADFARALDADPVARGAYDRLAYSRRFRRAGDRDGEEAANAHSAH